MGIAPTLGNMLLIIVVGVALKSVFLLVAQRQVGYTAAQVGTDLRLQMLRAVLRSKWEYFLHQPVGKLTNALATEAQRSSPPFVNGATAITFLIQALIYGGIAFALSWRASLVAIVAGILVIGLSHFLVRITRSAGKRRPVDDLADGQPHRHAAIGKAAQSHGPGTPGRPGTGPRHQPAEQGPAPPGAERGVLDSAQELMFTGFICLGVYVAIGKFQMDLPMVMVLVVALGRAFSFFGKVQKQYQKLAQGESAYWALMDSIDAANDAEEDLDGGANPHLNSGIRFDEVSFDYDQHPVFTDLSLDIKAGALTTLVGPSGSGKTTIIDLTIGLLQPAGGQYLLDGTPLQEVDIKHWRSLIGYVPQDTVLLHDSILHNVTLGDPALSDRRRERALRAAGAWDFVTRCQRAWKPWSVSAAANSPAASASASLSPGP